MPFDQDITCLQATDVSNYKETSRITSVVFGEHNFDVNHTKEGVWPNTHVPGWGDGAGDSGDIEWTLWIVLPVSANRWITTGCIEFWDGKQTGVGGPFSDAARNWYYFVPEMVNAPQGPGTAIGVFVTQGDHRRKTVETLQERSNVAWVTVPQELPHTYNFDEPATPVEPSQPEPGQPEQPEQPPTPQPPSPLDEMSLKNLIVGYAEAAIKDLVRVDQKLDTLATKEDIARFRNELIELGKQIAGALSKGGGSSNPGNAIANVIRLFGKQ